MTYGVAMSWNQEMRCLHDFTGGESSRDRIFVEYLILNPCFFTSDRFLESEVACIWLISC